MHRTQCDHTRYNFLSLKFYVKESVEAKLFALISHVLDTQGRSQLFD